LWDLVAAFCVASIVEAAAMSELMNMVVKIGIAIVEFCDLII